MRATPPGRLPLRRKVAYGAGDLGASLLFVAINTWLLYYLVNAVGLPPALAGVAFVAGRLLDAVLDPLMGLLSDRLRPRLGRLRFVRWGAPLLGLSFALLWALPAAGPVELRFALAVAAFALFGVLYTVVQVPYLALTPELAPDYDERTALSGWRLLFGVTASLLAVALPPVLVAFAAGGAPELAAAPARAWRAVGVAFGLIAVAAYAVTGWGVLEPPAPARPAAPTGRGLLREAGSAFAVPAFARVFALFVTVTVGLMIVNSMLPFFLESVLRLPPATLSRVLGTLFGLAVLAFPLWGALAARLGKRAALAAGLALLALGLALLVGTVPGGGTSAALWATVALSGTGLSAVMLFPWAMLPDAVEFDELAGGRRREGLLYALFTFGQKTAGSVGVFANALVAGLLGYVPGGAEQSPETLRAIAWMTGPVPAAVFVLALAATLRYPVGRAAHAAVRARLAAVAEDPAPRRG